ncbi:M14 family metallopeptidase [Intrasporangium calvum]|uniref:Zinc carboxypeptidase n=1 Tax=Intrasporangium calvum (strain ATCC 23552 / DSM 43043 / JCM 3097 / NBRC 12989 / NCIMB 10167 / NRRL B-3866 / 7 KIP) TaxID=710696 RepID=E6SC64_INTC7|nr:M14 family metallopeptidase [Intrasporangium calvum]ADU47408.1 peptidase M14 carboxypeptidase A [Intrasporangium calvum DSM 43043]
MRRLRVFTVVSAMVAALLVGLTPTASSSPPGGGDLDAYTAVVTPNQLAELARQGHDVHEGRQTSATGIQVELILTAAQRDQLRKQGLDPQLTRVKGGQTVKEFAAAEAAGGFTVWRSWDEPGGIKDQLVQAAAANPQVAKLVRIGTTLQGRDILAIKLTQGANGIADGSRPAVLYSATQHAREWISTEIDRRLMNWYIDRWRANDPAVRTLLQTTELWFVPVANPDGYQYTFDVERLWRKNLRDNNGDGQITTGDGVDLNRNFPNHWGYDEEGSSSIRSSETYRGTAPVSEPETAAMKGLLDRIGFAFQVNYHSNGQWLLYAEGWQIGTPTADDPIYYAMSGNLDEPAIKDFHPGLSSDVLYVTNGETTDYAHVATGALAWTPELSAGCDGCGFVFPDDEALVQEEFERNLPFAQSVAQSAVDPDDPASVLGIDTLPFYLESDDPYKRGNPHADLTFDYSYGDPQPVAVIAKRSLGAVTVKWQVNGGAVQSATTSEWGGGERYSPAAKHYRQMRGVVTGTSPGDSVTVWFEGGGETSPSFTYRAVSETGNRVVVVAAEDYTGASPLQRGTGPHYLTSYLDALKANGVAADVYDVDARGRTAPDLLGVLSHYDAAIWYSGDDIVTRTRGRGPGNVDRLALDEMLEFRAYLNEGGRVAYTSDFAGNQYTGNVGGQLYDPKGEIACVPLPAGVDERRCLLLAGSGDGTNDVLQYWFGGYVAVEGDGLDAHGKAFALNGVDDPFTGLTWGLNGPQSAKNQDDTMSYVATSGILPVEQFKEFESWPSAVWDKPGGPYAPHTGTQYAYSQIADISYKRLTRTVTVPAGGATLSFWTSYDTEPAWDHLFIEARTAGQDDWTTLPDQNGHTSTSTGDSCPEGWRDLHPQLDHYQTWDSETGACTATGTTGAWNAASGNSGGWQQWSVDLSGYAGGQVEVSIAYVSDWAVQGLGVFVDDVVVSTGEGSTSFEAGLDGWAVSGAPSGSGANANDWIVTDASGFPVGAAISTPDTVLMGFGLEGVTGSAGRAAVMGRVLDHLLN